MSDIDGESRDYQSELDILRGIAIIGVITIHISGGFTKISEVNPLLIVLLIIEVLVQFSVPMFVLISAYVIFTNYEKDFKVLFFYKKRLKAVLPPYIIFSLLYMPINFLSLNPFAITIEAPYTIIYRIATFTTFYHLYFIGLILQFYLIYPLISKIVNKFRKNLFTLFLLSIVIQMIWYFSVDFIVNYIYSFNDNTLILMYHIFEPKILGYMAYIFLGIYIKENYKNFQLKMELKIVSFILIMIIVSLTAFISYLWIMGTETYGPYNLTWIDLELIKELIQSLTMVLIFAVILLFFKISLILNKQKSVSNKFFSLFGRYSFGIYLLHAIILLIIQYFLILFLNIDYNYWYFYIICFIGTTSLSLLSIYIISKFSFHKLIIGNIRTLNDTDDL
jgi:peptidoglycan/LPS O-acetylase OafA/YrhL